MRSGRTPTLVDICTQGSSPRHLKNSSSSLPEPAQPIRCGRCQMGRWQSVFLKGTFVCKHGSAEACLVHRRISHNICRLCVRLSTHNQVSAQQQDSQTEFSDNFSRRVLRYKTTVQCVHFLLFLGCSPPLQRVARTCQDIDQSGRSGNCTKTSDRRDMVASKTSTVSLACYRDDRQMNFYCEKQC